MIEALFKAFARATSAAARRDPRVVGVPSTKGTLTCVSGTVVVADLGSGNLRSVEKALAAVGARVAISSDADTVARADKLVVPGQGAFGACAAGLDRGGGAMREAVRSVIDAGRPFFGICIGMQLLFERSEENPEARGLGVSTKTSTFHMRRNAKRSRWIAY